MRTTIQIDDALYADTSRLASASNRTVGALIEDALREMLLKQPEPRAGQKVTLRTFQGRGVKPGVDLNDSRRMRDIMEGINGSA